jgi:UDP-GlcNAc:undecaprenyl-phosphate GlcNAc-1-phosphate transferase
VANIIYSVSLSNIIIFLIVLFIIKKRQLICSKLSLIDHPDNLRKIHKTKTPILGGVIFLITWIYILLINFFIANQIFDFVVFAILFSIIGFMDDIFDIKPWIKLISSSILIVIIFYYNDIYLLKKLNFETKNIEINLSIFNIFFTTLCILLFINATNMADGINGLSISLLLFWYLSYMLKVSDFIIFSPLFISFLLFLFYNIRSKIFLGDSGIYSLAPVLSLLIIKDYNQQKIFFPEEIFLLFIIPGIDMFRIFLQRILNSKNPFSADNNHLHHYLTKSYNATIALLIYMSLSIAPYLIKIIFNIKSYQIITFFIVAYILTITLVKTKLKKLS